MFGITIKELPDKIDPVIILERKMKTCPFCNRVVNRKEGDDWSYDMMWADKNGINHKWKRKKNEFRWMRYNCICSKCGTEWTTDYVPLDNDYFKVYVKNPFSDVLEFENVIEKNGDKSDG